MKYRVRRTSGATNGVVRGPPTRVTRLGGRGVAGISYNRFFTTYSRLLYQRLQVVHLGPYRQPGLRASMGTSSYHYSRAGRRSRGYGPSGPKRRGCRHGSRHYGDGCGEGPLGSGFSYSDGSYGLRGRVGTFGGTTNAYPYSVFARVRVVTVPHGFRQYLRRLYCSSHYYRRRGRGRYRRGGLR